MKTRGSFAILGIVLGVLLAAPLFAGSGIITRPVASQVEDIYLSGITVIGDGQVKTQPDIAYVTVGVETNAPTAQEAQAKNNAVVNDVLAALELSGISRSNMQTSGLSLYPTSSKPGEVAGYVASNSLGVTVPAANAGKVLDTAIAAGANTSSYIRFAIKDDSALKTQALEEAMKAARPKADLMAKTLGLTIKGISSVVEDVSVDSATTMGGIGGGQGGGGTPVAPGELTVRARVKITYSY